MKKIIYSVVVGCIGMFLMSCGSSQQRKIVGKWVDADPRTMLGIKNFEFLKDGTVYLDGIQSKYTVEKNTLTIYMSVFGVTSKTNYEMNFEKTSLGEKFLVLRQPAPSRVGWKGNLIPQGVGGFFEAHLMRVKQ